MAGLCGLRDLVKVRRWCRGEAGNEMELGWMDFAVVQRDDPAYFRYLIFLSHLYTFGNQSKKFWFNTYTKILNFGTMATDPFLTTKSILGLAERVVTCPPPKH